MKSPLNLYPPLEERWNVLTHLVGFLLSVLASILLIARALAHGEVVYIISFSVFGASLSMLYLASTTYHAAKSEKQRRRLKIFDHIAIYVLIAGTYTPFSLITMQGTAGWTVFGVAWGTALVGGILKLFFAGRFKLLSTLLYIAMGWLVLLGVQPLVNCLQPACIGHSAGE